MTDFWYIEPLGIIEKDFDTACLIAIEHGLYPKEAVYPIDPNEAQEAVR